METTQIVMLVQGVALALLGVLVVGLLRSHATVLRALDELGAGRDAQPEPVTFRRSEGAASDVAGVGPDGEVVAVSVAAGSEPVLLAFLSAGCATCEPFWNELGSGTLADQLSMRTVVVTLGPDEESPTRVGRLASADLVTVMSSDAWRDYEVPGAPYFVVVDPATRHIIGEGQALAVDQLRSFLADAEADVTWSAERAPKAAADLAREKRVDRELLAAGIVPGDPQLFPATGDAS